MIISILVFVVIFAAYSFYAARAANICMPQYLKEPSSSPPPRVSVLDIEAALSLCNSRQRRSVLELAEEIENNYINYLLNQNNKKRDRFLSCSVFIPLIPAAVSYLHEREIWLPLGFVFVYFLFFFIQRKFHIGTYSYKEELIPSVSLHGSYDSAEDLIKAWNNALNRTGHPLVHNLNEYDSMFEKARAAFPILIYISLFFSLGILLG